ncbi:hypothetical protein OR16_07781 [Cupriavidus basilensis OR16]|uniref:Transmembrane protein n=1 Tax=Cupriavidus basilensis OR16 TaxID=1127483 RepID=H1S1L5_9BURK|nr:hypothetical protein [Cupriavidus basilensis]EHP43590.1 hypothetical protein OR16_07781 [Cupriavidus basilensis OR16]
MAGALLGAMCYASPDAAADAYYSGAAPSQTPGGTSYLSAFVKDAGVWKLRRYQVNSAGEVATLTDAVLPTMTFPACDPLENFKDGMTVGWGVVAAMVLAWGVTVLRRGL